MKKVLVIMNHSLTEDQLADFAKRGWEPQYLDVDQKAVWESIDPSSIEEAINIVTSRYEGNLFVIQGHPGAVVKFVSLYGGANCYYAQSDRISIDQPQPDGTVKKISQFKHKGFYSYL